MWQLTANIRLKTNITHISKDVPGEPILMILDNSCEELQLDNIYSEKIEIGEWEIKLSYEGNPKVKHLWGHRIEQPTQFHSYALN